MKRVIVDGHTLNKRTADMLNRAEERLGYKFNILQGSYNSSVGQSGGTHDGGGAVDVAPVADNEEAVLQLRKVGFAAWHRPELWRNGERVWGEHIHMGALDDPEASSELKGQFADYRARLNGLADNGPDTGPRLDPIPVWPIKLEVVSLARAINQFSKDNPRKTPAVARIQRVLNYRLGTHLAADGIAGPKTVAAFKKWEESINSPSQDGVPGEASLKRLLAGWYSVVK